MKRRPHHLRPPEAVVGVEVEVEDVVVDVDVDGVEAGDEEGEEGVKELQRRRVELTGT